MLFKRKTPQEKPITWEDITIGQYNRLNDVIAGKFDDEYMRLMNIMSITSGKPVDELLETHINLFDKKIKLYTGFIHEQPKPKMDYGMYKVGGRKFRFEFDIKKISTAQYIDLTNVFEHHPDNFSKIISRLLIPVNGSYNDGSYTLDELETQIENEFKIVYALGIAFFFSSLYQALLKATRTYSEQKAKKQAKKNRIRWKIENKEKASTNDGAGSSPLNK